VDSSTASPRSSSGNAWRSSPIRSADPPPELIAVATPGGPLVLIEGHARLTAYALYPEFLPDELEILLGTSEDVAQWSEY
jgi:hypothetical protein